MNKSQGPVYRVLVASDIFGATKAFDELAHQIAQDPIILSPYTDLPLEFKNEAEAYEYFCQHTSVNEYAMKIYNQISAFKGVLVVIGFSVGASALWKCLSEHADSPVLAFYGFYGSQIRHMLPATPTVPTYWYSARQENHFNVSEINTQLDQVEHVEVDVTPYLHGFMNRHSQHFDAIGYAHYLKQIRASMNTSLVCN
ncbi:dienelactone hydrolase family protein [Alteromonas facilis]|uniref:dienelactone hydrolase family protein n=1 Tax=Alteromonas facilis TaxID=2048004 RepID=UPI000C29410F|nr:dienelactone hydrolase family protein [Alteromonas facilis]